MSSVRTAPERAAGRRCLRYDVQPVSSAVVSSHTGSTRFSCSSAPRHAMKASDAGADLRLTPRREDDVDGAAVVSGAAS